MQNNSEETGSQSAVARVFGAARQAMQALTALTGQRSLPAQDKALASGIVGKLQACDAALHARRQELQSALAEEERHAATTRAVEAQYMSNLDAINGRVADLKAHMTTVIGTMAERVAALKSLEGAAASNNDVLEVFAKLMDDADALRAPRGVPLPKLFEHVNMEGVKLSLDYSAAVSANKTLLVDIARRRDAGAPLRLRVETVKRSIAALQNESALLREFQMKHAQLAAASTDTPVVHGEPTAVVDDSLQIVNHTL